MSSTEYGELIQYLDKKFTSIDERFDRVETRLDRLESRMDGLESRIDGLESRMDRLESRMTNLENKVTRLEVLMDGFAKSVLSVEQELAILIHRVDRIETWIKQVALKLGVPYLT